MRSLVAPVVVFKGIARTYPGSPPVAALRPVDLKIESGRYVTVVGPSGSGKSTFLNILGLLDRPTRGVYELDGIDVSSLPEKERTALRGNRIGFVFQAFNLLSHRSAVENVALALLYSGRPRTERIAAARAALDTVGLAHRAESLPRTMSGGEQQRVAIARALVHRPSLLLCDEPTGNLDSTTAGEVLGLLERLHMDRMTVVVITHDMDVARRGELTLSIRDGIVV
ncbi:ABC transporter ATP-binding protein [Actinoplanes sp. NPDC051411]|uniref:ABC transporter ATP-binding protein n=1 Tax=Actinoplanes sp. NPDC051411 TaxID=3155522 RepID=UPI0034448B48